MGWLLVGLGVLLIVVTLWDCFEALILPRRVNRLLRPSRIFYRTAWTLWRFVALRLPPGKRREKVLALKHPATAPIIRGLTDSDAAPASAMEIIIVIHVQLSIVANTRPRYSFETWRSS